MSSGMRFFNPSEYQQRAEQDFIEIRGRLSKAVPYAEIEHIGSSAIKGAVSKGDLDILVRIEGAQFAEAQAAIETLGFTVKQGTLRTDSLCMLEGPQGIAVQLIERGSKFEMFARFRDLMNAAPDLVEKYNALKMSSTGLSEEEYRARKSKFIEALLGDVATLRSESRSRVSDVEVPMPIRTLRLLIKPREKGEGSIVRQSVMESSDHLKPWMPWAHGTQTLEEAESLCRASVEDFLVRKDFVLSIYDPEGKEFIGSTGIHRPNWKVPSFMIGYWVAKKHEGKGLITETLNALTRYCFEVFKAKRVYLTCDAKNVRSLAVMGRLGYQQEGLLKNDSRDVNGELRDTIICARYDLKGLPDLDVHWG